MREESDKAQNTASASVSETIFELIIGIVQENSHTSDAMGPSVLYGLLQTVTSAIIEVLEQPGSRQQSPIHMALGLENEAALTLTEITEGQK